MKIFFVKLMILGFLVTALLTFWPQLMPLVNREIASPEVNKFESVLPPPGIKYLEKVEDIIFEMTNQIRRSKGLTPFIKDEELRNVARAYSNDMLVRQFFDHTTPEGVSFDERISNQYRHWVRFWGENIWHSFGYNFSNMQKLAKEIVNDWMNSPDHRDNLLSPDFTHLGVGVSARRQTIKATQEFVGRHKAFSFRK
jgi:uncharacterized protein YkwD